MRATKTAMAAALLAAAAATLPASADYLVKEVGSFHVGGRTTTLWGQTEKTSLRANVFWSSPDSGRKRTARPLPTRAIERTRLRGSALRAKTGASGSGCM